MEQRAVVAVLWLCLLIFGGNAMGRDNIYVAYDADGTPRFSTQPYDQGYALYLRNQPAPPAAKLGTAKNSLGARRAAIAPYIEEAARLHGMDPALLTAVAEIESGFNPNAVSPKGAMGAMQLIPKTAADYGVTNPYDLQQNLNGGTRFLKDLLAAHNGNLPLALAAYNAGRTNVTRHNQRIPPFTETMLYVPRVLAKMDEYQRAKEIR